MGFALPDTPCLSPEEFWPSWNTLAPLWRGLPSLVPLPLSGGVYGSVPGSLCPCSALASLTGPGWSRSFPGHGEQRLLPLPRRPLAGGTAAPSDGGEAAPPRGRPRPYVLRRRRRRAVMWRSSKMAACGECSAGTAGPSPNSPGIPRPGQLLSGPGSAGPAAPSGAVAAGGLCPSRISGETEYGHAVWGRPRGPVLWHRLAAALPARPVLGRGTRWPLRAHLDSLPRMQECDRGALPESPVCPNPSAPW